MADMSSSGSMFDEQSAIAGACFAATQAIKAKVGEAASPSQPAPPRGRQANWPGLFTAEHVAIFNLPIDCRRFRPLQVPSVYNPVEMHVRVTKLTRLRWIP